jgi:hypothetical protein
MRSRALVFVACVFVAVPVLTAVRQGTVHAFERCQERHARRHPQPAPPPPPRSPLDGLSPESPR